MSLVRSSTRLCTPAAAAATRAAATRAFTTRRQQQQQSSQSSSRFHTIAAFGLSAAVIGTGAALCDSAAEPAKVANAKVDYEAVRKDIAAAMEAPEGYDDGSYGPLFLRLAWHASGTYDVKTKTGGSSAASMRFQPESNHGANAGLGLARDILEKIKQKHPNISYGDLWTLAGVVAIEEMGGPKISWRPGRVDGDASSCTPDGRLPDAAQGYQHVRDIFYRMGFNDREIVALVGAHSLGRCHRNRSGFEGPWTRAPTTVSNEYYRVLLNEKWTPKKWNGPLQYENAAGDLMMLPADIAFIQDAEFKKFVQLYANEAETWEKDFSAAVSKLFELGVKFPNNKPWYRRWF